MRLSTRGRYSLRIMAELGKNYYRNDNNVLELNRIAKNQSLSVKYIEHIISDLRKAGLVSSERGVAGGYRLSRSPERITLFDILQATEKISKIVSCIENRDTCALQDVCAACDIWEDIQKVITDHLKTRKLTNFLKMQEEKTGQQIIPKA
jgi:Rrf2 family protein